MAVIDKLNVEMNVKVKVDLTLWSAIKLRIAGKRYHKIAEETMNDIFRKKDKEDE